MPNASNTSLHGKYLAITGRLSVPRCEAIHSLEKAGAIYMQRVTRPTNILLIWDIRAANGATRKRYRANKLIAGGHQLVLISGEVLTDLLPD